MAEADQRQGHMEVVFVVRWTERQTGMAGRQSLSASPDNDCRTTLALPAIHRPHTVYLIAAVFPFN